jgi:tetratricopeptide (TPR) repeat protein
MAGETPKHQADTSKQGGRAELSPVKRKRLEQMFEYASKQAAQEEYDVACEMFGQCVAGDPFNLKYLRAYVENLQKKYNDNKRGASFASLQAMGARSALKKALNENQWEEVIKNGLKVLALNPWDVNALRAMATAASRVPGGGDCEMFYLKCAFNASSKDPETNRQYAKALAGRGQLDAAIACWRRVREVLPDDEEAARSIADLLVRKSIRQPSYEETDKALASKQVQAAQRQQEELSAEERLRRRIRENPNDILAYHELAQLYLDGDRFKEAEDLYAEAYRATSGNQEILEKWEDVQIRRLRHETALARHRRKESPAAEEEYRRLRKALNDKELEICKRRCERYPTNLRFKYDLGVRYQIARQPHEAIKQFQLARNDPRCKGLCLLGLGQCFQAINQRRMAMSHYEAAVAEIPDRDAEHKKEALYLAGKLALEELNDLDTAERHLTALAALDFTYRDVAALLDKVTQLRENPSSPPSADSPSSPAS